MLLIAATFMALLSDVSIPVDAEGRAVTIRLGRSRVAGAPADPTGTSAAAEHQAGWASHAPRTGAIGIRESSDRSPLDETRAQPRWIGSSGGQRSFSVK